MTRRSALLVPLAAALLAASCGRAPEPKAFATRAAAGTAVPAWVPASAADLKLLEEARGAFWLRFRLDPAARPALEAALLRIPDAQVATLTFRPPRGVSWWFRGLVQVVPARETTVVAADVFSGRGEAVPRGTFIAFDRASDAVYAWSAGR